MYIPIFKEDYNSTTIIPSDDLEFFNLLVFTKL